MSETTRKTYRYREGRGRRCCAFCRESVRDPKLARAPRFPCVLLEEIADARMLCDGWVAVRHQDAAIVVATEKLEEATENQRTQIVLNTPDVEGILDEVRVLVNLVVQKEMAVYDLLRQVADLKKGDQHETDEEATGKDHARGEQGASDADRGGPGPGVG